MSRLFFAIWPDAAGIDRLRGLAEALAVRVGGRPVPRDHLHLTLAFLGELDDACAATAASLPLRARRFPMTLDRLGSFRKARVAWAGYSRMPAALGELESSLAGTLRNLGFELEERPFTPHVTLVRKAERALAAEPLDAITWEVEELTLVQSRAGRYEVAKRWGFS